MTFGVVFAWSAIVLFGLPFAFVATGSVTLALRAAGGRKGALLATVLYLVVAWSSGWIRIPNLKGEAPVIALMAAAVAGWLTVMIAPHPIGDDRGGR